MNTLIIESTPDELTLEIMQAVRDGDLTWSQGEILKGYVQEGRADLARDLLAAWIGS